MALMSGLTMVKCAGNLTAAVPTGILLPALSLEPVDQNGLESVAGSTGDNPHAHVTWWDTDHRTKEGRRVLPLLHLVLRPCW